MTRRTGIVALVAVFVAVGAAFVGFRAVPPQYGTTSTILVVAPSTTNRPFENGPRNPFLYLDKTGIASRVAQLSLGATDIKERVEQEFDASFEVSADQQSSAPVVQLTTMAPEPELAREALRFLIAVLPRRVAELESELAVGNGARLSFYQLVRPQTAEKIMTESIRTAISAAVVASLLSGAVGSLLLRRRGNQ